MTLKIIYAWTVMLCLVKSYVLKKDLVLRKSVSAVYSFDLIFHRYFSDL
jgi:hypothetical protein